MCSVDIEENQFCQGELGKKLIFPMYLEG
jgi:hypothetical protein